MISLAQKGLDSTIAKLFEKDRIKLESMIETILYHFGRWNYRFDYKNIPASIYLAWEY